ncbi:MAG: hypothetical protein LBH65_00440, partial [Desulfovibrio sp.]|nr:hypothetical protein [Desulfovibrio sp.]
MDTALTREEQSHFIRRLKTLEDERKNGWESHWRSLARNFLPRRSRFLDAGERTNSGEIMNMLQSGVGILCLRVLANGMQSGLTSPARPWFSLDFTNKALADSEQAKLWLHDTYEKMVEVFRQTNFYDQVHILYSELACFGTACMIIEGDYRNVIRCRTLTVGEYALDAGEDGRVDTLYRRVRMTPRQIVQAWPDTAPDDVRSMVDNDVNRWITILHAIEPNKKHKQGSRRRDERPFRSVYMIFEGAQRAVLEDSGYYEFPALCPRWITTASDIYGSSPAMDALGDCRELQKVVEMSRIGLEKEVDPPLLVYNKGIDGVVDTSSGGINYASGLTPGQEAVVPLSSVKANLPAAERWIAKLENILQRHFHNDLFLMISEADKRMTATEVAERQGEKLLMLGPVLDRLRSEMFQPLIERVYGIMDRKGLVAFPPPGLEGEQVNVEFISILAQAQKQAGIGGISQTIAFAGQVAQLYPQIVDKFNFDEMANAWAEMQGIAPNLMRSDEEVSQLREDRAKQEQMAQIMAMAQQGADAAAKGSVAAKNMQP